MVVARVVVFAVGLLIVQGTLRSALRTVVVPRGEGTRLQRTVVLAMRAFYDLVARLKRGVSERERALARFGPTTLLALAAVWAIIVMVGFAAMFWAVSDQDLRHAVALSGSSLTTLGVRPPNGNAESLLAITEALIGLGIVALLISYLPTIYTLFGRREAQVVKLDGRAGSPPTALTMLRRFYAIGWIEQMDDEWNTWENWFAELEESHTSFPILVFFRSQRENSSWATAAGAVLDTMALSMALVDRPHRPQTQLTLREGFMALRAIAYFFRIPVDADPKPNDPISIYRGEFDLLCDELAEIGIPLKPDREQAWRDFAGWRVNYDAALLGLCALAAAPATPWSSDRSDRFHRPTLRRPRWVVDPLDNPPSW